MMIAIALLLFAAGLFLSAFFSGAETGFYRATRLRLLLDSLGGDWTARGLLWLTNHPSMFVATTLVGNNMANYVCSMAIVIGTQAFFTGSGHLPELIAPILLAPVVFVYGELMPKNLFYEAPNRLLRRCGPALMSCTWLFLPVSSLLWGLAKVVQWFLGVSPQTLQLVLARRELEQVFEEGHEAGILRPAQRGLAQGLFAVASSPVGEFATPAARVPRVDSSMSKQQVIRLAQRQRLVAVPVEEPGPGRRLLGYLALVDLYLDSSPALPTPRPLVDILETDTYIAALMRLQGSNETLGRVVTAGGETRGFVTARQLSAPLFRGQ